MNTKFVLSLLAFSCAAFASYARTDSPAASDSVVTAPSKSVSVEVAPPAPSVITEPVVALPGAMDDGRMSSEQSGQKPRIDPKNIKPMTSDAKVNTGVADSGLKYCLVANDNVKGIADFALLTPDTLIIRHDVALFKDDRECDRTLVEMFSLYKDAEKTCVLVVAGDIDPEQIKHKIALLSLLETPKTEYSFHHDDDFFLSPGVSSALNGKTFSYTFESPRLPLELLNTALPLAMTRMDSQMGILCTRSLMDALTSRGVKYESVDFTRKGVDMHFGHNKYCLSVTVASDKYAQEIQSDVDSLAMDVLWNIKAGNFDKNCFTALVTQTKYSTIKTLSCLPITNSEYVDRCLKAEIFNTSLASREDVISINRRTRPDNKGYEIFSRYCKRMFGGLQEPRDTISLLHINYRDTLLSGVSYSKKKTKITKTFIDTSTGGTTWVFSNGLRVCYRKMTTDGIFYYGVYSSLPKLNIKESNLLSSLGFSTNYFPEDKLGLFIKLLAYYSGGVFERNGMIFLVGELDEEYVSDKFASYAHNFYTVNNMDAVLEYFDSKTTMSYALASIELSRHPGTRQIDADELSILKTILSNEILSMQQSPLYWLECARIRYCCGRKVNTGYDLVLSGITLDDVNAVLCTTCNNLVTSPWIIRR